MRTRIIILAVALLVTAFFIVPSNISTDEKISVNKPQNQLSDIPVTNDKSELPINISETETWSPDTNITPIPTQTNEIIDETTQDSVFAQITIETAKKTKTFDVMPDVDEKTLRRNIGWLPSSALPGQEGLCILMGHRDTDFRILENICIGDKLIITREGLSYSYTVIGFDIIDCDCSLRFDSLNGQNIILVTCYPFRYIGYAPKKYLVLAN